MRKKIDFIVLNNTTLELKESANKGDWVDLEAADALDLTFFSKEIDKRAKDVAKKIVENQVALVSAKSEGEKKRLEAEIKALKSSQTKEIELAQAKAEQKAKKDINELEKQLASARTEAKDAVKLAATEAQAKYEGEKKRLEAEIKALKSSQTKEIELAQAKAEQKAKKDINELEKQLASARTEAKDAVKLAATEAQAKYEKKIASLENEILVKENQLKQTEQQWMHRHLATKSYGEELEQFIYQEFEQAQQNGAYPNAKFVKDNKVITNADDLKGSKGDFTFKDYDDKGNEILSIEIEIKTEQKTNSSSKTHNKDHFEKLNKDRNNKHCEYAILISELEKENKVYDGIYKVRNYDKMYVVRPQTFLSLINILKDSLSKNNELIEVINQKNTEFSDKETFLTNLSNAQANFNANILRSQSDLEKAIAQIDDSINKLSKAKAELVKSGNQLRIANDKVLELTPRKLLKGCKEDPFKK